MQFFGQWSPPVDKVLYENYFKVKRNGFFIEAGASEGVNLSCCLFFEKNLGWKGINVEPAKEFYSKLVINRPNSINLNIGLSDKEEILEFNDVRPGPAGSGCGNGSFHHDEEHKKELSTYNVEYEKYKVKTFPYYKVISQNKISEVDLFTLDVEGLEFKVLDGMKKSKILPKVMCIEYSYLGLRKLINYIKPLGYKFDFISYNNAYFHHNSFDISKKEWFGETKHECSVVDGQIVWKDIDL